MLPKINEVRLYILNNNFSISSYITTEDIKLLLNFPGHPKLLIIDHNPGLLMTSNVPVCSKTIQYFSWYCGCLLHGRGHSLSFVSHLQVTLPFFTACWIMLFNKLYGIPICQFWLAHINKCFGGPLVTPC